MVICDLSSEALPVILERKLSLAVAYATLIVSVGQTHMCLKLLARTLSRTKASIEAHYMVVRLLKPFTKYQNVFVSFHLHAVGIVGSGFNEYIFFYILDLYRIILLRCGDHLSVKYTNC